MKALTNLLSGRILASILLFGNFLLLPVTADEAYYFSWGKDLSMGYFDHPPLLGWIMNLLQPSTLRIPFILLSLLLVWTAKNRTMALTVLIPGAHLFLGGALPDTLMVFFGFLVIRAFKNWIQHTSVANAVVLGSAVAALGYSKFHGILLIVALAAGYWKYRKEWTLYLAIGIAGLLLLPYLRWQMHHEWVTFQYHFSGRFHERSLKGLFEFALLGAALWWPLFLYFRELPLWSKSLLLLSFMVFGWGAFKGSAELHWLLVWLWIVPELPIPTSRRIQGVSVLIAFLHTLLWVPQIQQSAGLDIHFRPEIVSLPDQENVAFLDSYQDAALYEFYSGRNSYNLAHPGIRLSQYSLKDYPFEGQPITVYNRWGMGAEVPGTPWHSIQTILHNLSKLEYSWNGYDLVFDDSHVPVGYQWVLYNYVDGQQLERRVICPGKESPIISYQAGKESFLTLEKNWLPTGLWIPLP